jgi:hypothetical protein
MAAANYRKNGLEMEQFKPKFHLMYEERYVKTNKYM